MSKKVFICGAGPVGLTAAIRLLRSGISCRIVDKRVGIDRRSKALSISPATLELLDSFGVINEALALGNRNPVTYIHWKGSLLHRISLAKIPSRYPYFLMLPQFETEAILHRLLRSLGGEVEAGSELLSVQQREDRVHVVTSDANGHEGEATYEYLIGCDGPKSTVRQAMAIPFTGYDYGMFFILCDAIVEWPRHAGKWRYYVDEDSFLILIPMAGGLHRIVIKLNGRFDPQRVWRTEDFRRLIDRMGLRVTLGKPIWSSSAPLYNRLAERFRSGRVFLAGDAAHLFSPIGGQGMNTGVQDAYNLASKLALRCCGTAGDELLEAYERERRAVAVSVREWTDRLTRLIARIDLDPHGPLRNFLPSARNGLFLTKLLPEFLAGISTTEKAATKTPRRLSRTNPSRPECRKSQQPLSATRRDF